MTSDLWSESLYRAGMFGRMGHCCMCAFFLVHPEHGPGTCMHGHRSYWCVAFCSGIPTGITREASVMERRIDHLRRCPEGVVCRDPAAASTAGIRVGILGEDHARRAWHAGCTGHGSVGGGYDHGHRDHDKGEADQNLARVHR